MYGVRLARAYTGKRIIIKVSGGWHGYNSDLLTAVGPPFNVESAGVEDASSKTIVVPFNDLDAAKKVINENRKDLACFVVEPILGGGLIPATSEYLKGLREETERVGCLLFFDEVITGFRLALGGAQQFYDVKPDICTLGKILGGGLPASALTGKKRGHGFSRSFYVAKQGQPSLDRRRYFLRKSKYGNWLSDSQLSSFKH